MGPGWPVPIAALALLGWRPPAGSSAQRGLAVTQPAPRSSCDHAPITPQPGVGTGQAWATQTAQLPMPPVSVHTNGTVFAADTDVTFVAVTAEAGPLVFTWDFGDQPPMRTAARSIRRRLRVPRWYRVVVRASDGRRSATSAPHRVWVQSRVVPNRLAAPASALVHTAVPFQCRINFGTDVAYLWDFGDGAGGLGNSTAWHVYGREGEFTVHVVAFNNVSAASLRKRLFVVRRPCQPPPVRNMGPREVQLWRSQPVTLRVTFEAAILCDLSQGLSYAWILTDAAGLRVALPPAVLTHMQTLTVPPYFLEPGGYSAMAKVQVEGSVVYANYHVGLRVGTRPPVSVIAEGTHLLVARTPTCTVRLRGSLSYDPDRPGAALRYHWACSPAGSPGRPCFRGPPPRSLDAGDPVLSFAGAALSDGYDQFLVTLTVSSRGRNSSGAQVFLSTRPDPLLRFVHISWVHFRDVSVNWNEALSLRAACEGCGDAGGLSYAWDLFLVNATQESGVEGPFCRTAGLLGTSPLGAALGSPASPGPSRTRPQVTATPSSREPWPPTPGRPDLPTAARASAESPGPSPPGRDPAPQAPDFEAFYGDIQEAGPSGGRQPGTHGRPPGSGPLVPADGESGRDGDSLLGPFVPPAGAGPTLLVDWPKSPVGRAAFRSRTASGTTGQTVTIKPFSLRPGETYVLQASVASQRGPLGKAQRYVRVNPAPRGVACQVQPRRGLEAHTVFSVFCMAGAPDFRYEFSYQIGNASRRTLYRGTDAQHYFPLPAGDPGDGHRVLVSTEITDGEGSRTQPCAVAVTVLPRFHGNHCPGEDLYNASMHSLAALRRMGLHADTRLRIALLTRALGRWAQGGRAPPCRRWSRMQDALIASVGMLPSRDQEETADSVLLLRDLVRFPQQLSLASVALIHRQARTLLRTRPPAGHEGRVRELVRLLSRVLELTAREPPREAEPLWADGLRIVSDALLGFLASSAKRQLRVRAGLMAFSARRHAAPRRSVQSLGPVTVHLPADLPAPGTPGTPGPCYISQLAFFASGSYPEAHGPAQAGPVAVLSLHSCSSRRPLHGLRLRTPVTVEFGEDQAPGDGGNGTAFTLLRGRVNSHRFIGLPGSPRGSLQIRVEFSRPVSRAFPVMLLVRFSEKPTPAAFLLKRTYAWDGRGVHVSLPPGTPADAASGYLSLLDADHAQRPRHGRETEAVTYAVRFQWVRCLFGDTSGWSSAAPSARPGASPGAVTCSYDRPAAFSVVRTNLNASFETSDVSALQGQPENLLPSVFIVFATILYALLVTKCRRVDRHERKKNGYIFLQENVPPGHQPYAVVVDTGFRAPARFTAEVYIVLCGEHGVSEPHELRCPETPLFERNSRHTFVLSTPARLGPLCKVRLWHNSRGPSAAWYVSHVMVTELPTRGGQSWFFPAECWLAVGRRDGRVHRELACLRRGPGFCKLLYSKFTEYLEDFHVWASVHSRPSGRGPLHTPRLSVAFATFCAHACLTALVTAATGEQVLVPAGPPGIPFGAVRTGLLCALALTPGAQLLSLLFRLSEEPGRLCRAPRQRPTGAPTAAARAPGRGLDRPAAPACPGSAVWAVCGTVAVACGLGTACVGYRFGPAQGAHWLCLLTLSVTCCVFVTQPLAIGLVALGFAWKRKDDECFFSASLREATGDLRAELGGTCRPASPSCGGSGAVERAVAARQRARRLHRARPASPARLRAPRERTRTEVRARAALRDLSVGVLMLLLHVAATHGTLSPHERALHRALRAAFARSPPHGPGGPHSADAWWDWSLTVLLDGLYPRGSGRAQPGALGGKCHLIGPVLIMRLTRPPGGVCQLLGPFAVTPKDSLPTSRPKAGGPETPSVTDPTGHAPHGSGAGGGREDCGLSLGRTRREAHAALTGLRAAGWAGRSPRGPAVGFTLYSPPGRLLSSVTLRVRALPAGRLALSCRVESLVLFHSDAAPWHHLPQLAVLGVTLAHLCAQLHRVADSGVRSYWRDPRNWLELPIAVTGLAYCAASGLLLAAAGEVAEQVRRGLFQASVDLGLVAAWNQRTRWLQGALSFLLTLKCAQLLGLRHAAASHSFTRRRVPHILTSGLACALLLAAHCHLHGLPPWSPARPARSLADAAHRLPFRLPGSSPGDAAQHLPEPDPRAAAWRRAALLAAASALCFGMLRASLLTFARNRKPRGSTRPVGLTAVAVYTWGKARAWLRRERPELEAAGPPPSPSCSLDEFADLLDELLLKIDGLSDTPELPLPERGPRDAREAGAEGGSRVGASAEPATGVSK